MALSLKDLNGPLLTIVLAGNPLLYVVFLSGDLSMRAVYKVRVSKKNGLE